VHLLLYHEGVLVYHGSNIAVEVPRIITPSRALDFGSGFYATMNLGQAESFAGNVVNRNNGQGIPTVSYYEIDFDRIRRSLNVLEFNSPDNNWLDFVYANRTLRYTGESFDVVIGPVANDTLYRVFRLFESGDISRETVIERLKSTRLFNQVTFCTDASVSQLKFVKSTAVKNG